MFYWFINEEFMLMDGRKIFFEELVLVFSLEIINLK